MLFCNIEVIVVMVIFMQSILFERENTRKATDVMYAGGPARADMQRWSHFWSMKEKNEQSAGLRCNVKRKGAIADSSICVIKNPPVTCVRLAREQ